MGHVNERKYSVEEDMILHNDAGRGMRSVNDIVDKDVGEGG